MPMLVQSSGERADREQLSSALSRLTATG